MICEACKRQIGLRAAWQAHPKLSAPSSETTSDYCAATYQKLYRCSECGTVLVQGQNTGWAEARLAQH